MPGWSPVAFLTDVGPTLALGDPGNNLLSPGATDATVVVTLYRDGRPARAITLAEIAPPGERRATVSHVAWGTHVGFDGQGRYRVETLDKRILAFTLEGPPQVLPR